MSNLNPFADFDIGLPFNVTTVESAFFRFSSFNVKVKVLPIFTLVFSAGDSTTSGYRKLLTSKENIGYIYTMAAANKSTRIIIAFRLELFIDYQILRKVIQN
jgi:hypothetical protein